MFYPWKARLLKRQSAVALLAWRGDDVGEYGRLPQIRETARPESS